MDDESYAKVTLEEINEGFGSESRANPAGLLRGIGEAITSNGLVDAVRRSFDIPAVRQYISKEHVARQLLLSLEEETYGKGIISEFLWQLVDMYGPIWSPMPKENHFDFFRGSERSEPMLKGVTEFEKLKQQYGKARSAIMTQAAEACLARKNAWFDNINNLLEVRENAA